MVSLTMKMKVNRNEDKEICYSLPTIHSSEQVCETVSHCWLCQHTYTEIWTKENSRRRKQNTACIGCPATVRRPFTSCLNTQWKNVRQTCVSFSRPISIHGSAGREMRSKTHRFDQCQCLSLSRRMNKALEIQIRCPSLKCRMVSAHF